MIKYFVAAISAMLLVAASLPANSAPVDVPPERIFPSSVGEVVFHHQMHIKDLSIKCVDCHHQINAKKLSTPHPDYFKSSSVKCEICHDESEKIKQKAYDDFVRSNAITERVFKVLKRATGITTIPVSAIGRTKH